MVRQAAVEPKTGKATHVAAPTRAYVEVPPVRTGLSDRLLELDRIGRHDFGSMAELRADVLRLIAYATGVCGLAFLNPFIIIDNRPIEPLLMALALITVAVAARQIVDRSVKLASIILTSGSILIVSWALYAYPSSPVACVYSLIVLTAGILLNWPVGFATAAVVSTILLGVRYGSPELISDGTFGVAVFLAWAGAMFGWLAWNPVQTALDWAWNSYAQASRKTDEARDRQRELAELSRSLRNAVDGLERVNKELERARKAAEEARRLKAEFAASVSHELRTPLNLIIGFSEMMVMEPGVYGSPLPPSYRGDVEAIYRNACHLSNLVDDVLDLSKIDVRRMGLQREPVELERVVEEAVAAVRTMFRDKGLGLEVRLPPELPILNVDRTRVRQILINLLNNALRFTSSGGITIGGTCDSREVVVWVSDTGTGIPPEDRSHVFDEFYQVRGQDGRRSSGLGLTICKRFVELHGGSMWVESQPGEGSTFYLSLPLALSMVAHSLSVMNDSRGSGSSTETAPQTVVILHDDAEAAKVLQRYLDGYRALAATSMEELLRMADHEPIRAVVVAQSGTADGVDARLSGTHDLPRIPTITCRLHSSQMIVQQQGVVQCLGEPITRKRIRETLLRGPGKEVRDVLIADNDPEMLRLLTRMLQSGRVLPKRCRVRTALDGEAALRAMRERLPDVVLLDLLLPRMDGYGVLAQMQADELLQAVPVVLLPVGGIAESVTVSELRISQPGGLSVGEAMRCLGANLKALLGPPDEHSVPVLPATPGA